MPQTFELKGYYVAVGLFVLTAIVGSAFIVLGPKATERSPGILHVGIRYSDELSIQFAKHPKSGPGATIAFLDSTQQVVYQFEELKIGRNLVPIEPDQIPSGRYIAQLTAPDYQPLKFEVQIEGRMLNPTDDADYPDNVRVAYNLVGVRFEPAN
ncbi:hypothetical protein [Coraliomargarita akajimensis]|uniref:Uncharacterized protein n=1 Tax=Coraliomargarita akajimensis (strain DSM 45221 / IAM 15411 / JCM 23193 / KCTC 12865 / 04OKA010-24) TaxID=583355 RepID=D5EKG1_CORAD|nr:hypothetical protein [Coraliomargarita akajimensis]ADE53042.1 hypothetical protein Caka_0013 [Coraliomargarita akajimensis DSM 45221]